MAFDLNRPAGWSAPDVEEPAGALAFVAARTLFTFAFVVYASAVFGSAAGLAPLASRPAAWGVLALGGLGAFAVAGSREARAAARRLLGSRRMQGPSVLGSRAEPRASTLGSRAEPRASTAQGSNCKPPFRLTDDGVKSFKPECF